MQNIEFSSYNYTINNLKLHILEHGYLHAGQDWEFSNLSSPFNRLYFVLAGSASIRNKYNNVTLSPGNAYIVPLNNSYDYICQNSLNKFYIHFRIEIMPGHDLLEGHKYCSSLPIPLDTITEMVSNAGSNSIGNFIQCHAIILNCIGKFISESSIDINEQIILTNKYYHLYDYIKNNCYADLRVKNIAEKFGIPANNLSKSFKNDTGKTLKQYIEDKIIQKCQELLLTTDLNIKEVAYELNFSEEFHFSRFFKKYTGISPSKYRQRNNTFK